MTRVIAACCTALLLVWSAPAFAQARDAKLLVTVVDQTGAVLPGATLTVIRADDPTQKIIGPVKSDEKGIATLEGLAPATYLVQVEFPGFEPRILKDVRLRAGDNKQGAI